MATGYRTDSDENRIVRNKLARASRSKAMRAAFLDHLAATCNVKQSAAVANVDVRMVYKIRRREPVFAAKWEEALALGYQMIETRLVGHVLAGRCRTDPLSNEDSNEGPIDFESALRLLAVHRNPTGKPRKGGVTPQFATREETDMVFLKRLRMIEARRAREAEYAAAIAAGKAGPLAHDAGTRDPVSACNTTIDVVPEVKALRNGD